MSSNKLIELPKFDYSSLDFETIISDVQNLILEHPEYLENWDDFLETNAGRMILEMNAFIMEKFTSKLDWMAREMFISTATQRQSQINILQLINYKPKLPSASYVNMSMKVAKWYPSFTLPMRFSVSCKDNQGNIISFELIRNADDGKPDYNFQYDLNTGNLDNKIKEFQDIPFYEGTTLTERDIFMDGVSNETYQLRSSPVIRNSVRVYSETTGKEFVEVDSFISPEAQQEDLPESARTVPYMISIDAQNRVVLKFGHENIVSIPQKGEKIKIMYRVGGGSNTNVVKGAINTTKTISVDGNRITILTTNPAKAFGGSDSDNIEQAKLTAPLSLRSANKTVTNEDYISHVEEIETVHRAKIVSKENEPEDIFKDYGHFLPPLDTWIYAIPVVEGIEDINPINYNNKLKLSRPYNDNGWIAYDDFEFTTSEQTVYIPNIRKYQSYVKHITLFEETPEGENGVVIDSYEENVDYTIDYVRSEITRIQSSDGGTIPSGNRSLRILYLKNNSLSDFYSKCFRSFSSGRIILSDNAAVNLFPSIPVAIRDKYMSVIYREGVDYTMNYNTNTAELIPSGNISDNDSVVVTYADYWDDSKVSEEKIILDSIKNKKMLCVDNYVKETIYNTFDISATVYCYKNLKGNVEQTLPEKIRDRFGIENAFYDYPISKAEIISFIMNESGVRFVDVDYLGRDYGAYRRFIRDELTSEQLSTMSANKVEHKIQPKYNEILILSWDEYDGIASIENQRHGLILHFVEA